MFPRPDLTSCVGGAARKSIGKSHGLKKIQGKSEKVVENDQRNCMKLLDLMLVNQDFFLPGRDGGDLKCWIFNV